MQLEDKLAILADSAKYDVACTSSGVDRAGVHGLSLIHISEPTRP